MPCLARQGSFAPRHSKSCSTFTVLVATQPLPAGARVGVLTNGGSPGILASDACESHGLTLPELAPKTMAAFRAFLPAEATVANPVDMLGSASADHYERELRLLLADEQLDAVLVLFVPPLPAGARDVVDAIRRAAAKAAKPVLPCLIGTRGLMSARQSLRDAGMPAYGFPESAALALARAVSYQQGRAGRCDCPHQALRGRTSDPRPSASSMSPATRGCTDVAREFSRRGRKIPQSRHAAAARAYRRSRKRACRCGRTGWYSN